MAITKTNDIHPAEQAAPFKPCTCTSTVSVGDLLVALVEFNGNSGATEVINMTVSDDTNTGNYTRIGQAPLPANGSTDILTLYYMVANATGTPTLSTSTLTGGEFGKVACLSFTGFTGTPTLDTNIGAQQVTQAGGNTSADVFIGTTTNSAPSVAICQIYINGTFFQPVPTGWSFGQSQFYIYKICSSIGTSLEVNGTYSGTNTTPGSIFLLANIYDSTGDTLTGQAIL